MNLQGFLAALATYQNVYDCGARSAEIKMLSVTCQQSQAFLWHKNPRLTRLLVQDMQWILEDFLL